MAFPSALKPRQLDPKSFAAFGDVIEVNEHLSPLTINDGFTLRYDDLAKVDVTADDGRALINIFRSTPLPQPLLIRKLECHPLSSQAFIPLGDNPYLVVVAPAGKLDINAVQVFLAASHQGVNYHRGTWHHYCLALNAVSDFLVVDRGGDGTNCDEADLDGGLEILTGTQM